MATKRKIGVKIKDRQTGKQQIVFIEAESMQEAKLIAMEKFGVAYEIM